MVIFDQQIRAFRAWMKTRGQQNKPLIVSEYGVIYGFIAQADTAPEVQDFMIKTFDYFLNTQDCSLGYTADQCRLVQRWAWYSFNDNGQSNGFNPFANLFDPLTFQITSTGARFREYSLTEHLTRLGSSELLPKRCNSLGKPIVGGICRADMRGRCLQLLRMYTLVA